MRPVSFVRVYVARDVSQNRYVKEFGWENFVWYLSDLEIKNCGFIKRSLEGTSVLRQLIES